MRLHWILILMMAPMGWAADPVIGTWKLNVAKSIYIPGPAPSSQMRVYEAIAQGIKVTIRTVNADGKSTTVEHEINYDAKDRPITGSSQADAIALEKVDEYTSESTLKHANKIIGLTRRTVSMDGKTMTILYQGADERRRTVKNTSVYDRQ